MSTELRDRTLLRTQSYINGCWLDNGSSLDVTNPATGQLIAQVGTVGSAETTQAIAAAAGAMYSWKARPAGERAKLLRRWYELIIANQEDLAILMTAEQGKVLAESRAEISYAASFVEWFAEEARRVYGDVIALPKSDQRGLVIKQPVGVVGAITPWNFPAAMITRKAAPALAVGCTIVVKPASDTPLSALALAELADRAGLPPGVFNVLTGSSQEIGSVLTSSELVRKLSFTGSTPVGKTLLKQCSDTVKKISMELGGNAPLIVFDDADLDAAVAGAAASKYRNSGQTCICANRILVQDSVYEEFISRLHATVSRFNIGNGMSQSSTHGPVINARAAQEVHRMVQDAIAGGAKLVAGGRIDPQGECFYQPTILANVNSQMRVFKEEIFGPVAPIFRFSDEAEAIAMANDTEFGLASYIFTRDIGRAWRVSEAIEYGMVGVNEVAITSEVIPFGGVKQSGMGREGSKYGTDDYVEMKYICMGGLQG